MALKSWIFLLQSAKDLSWRSLGPGVIVPPGVYRLSLQSPKPNRALEVRLRYASGEGDPIVRRYSLESDDMGHLPILAPLDFEAGEWEIDCRPDVFTALSGEDWRQSLRFEVGEAEQVSDDRYQMTDISDQELEDAMLKTDLSSDKIERRNAFWADLPAVAALTEKELQFSPRRSAVLKDLSESLTLEAPAVMEPPELETREVTFSPRVDDIKVLPLSEPLLESTPPETEDAPACRLVNYVLQLDDLEKQRRFTVDITLWEDLSRGSLPLDLPRPQTQNSFPYRTVPCPNHILPPKLRPRTNGAGQPRLKLPRL